MPGGRGSTGISRASPLHSFPQCSYTHSSIEEHSLFSAKKSEMKRKQSQHGRVSRLPREARETYVVVNTGGRSVPKTVRSVHNNRIVRLDVENRWSVVRRTPCVSSPSPISHPHRAGAHGQVPFTPTARFS